MLSFEKKGHFLWHRVCLAHMHKMRFMDQKVVCVMAYVCVHIRRHDNVCMDIYNDACTRCL